MRTVLRKTVVVLLVVGVILGAALLLARQQRFEWTTDSRAALESFEAGQEAAGKLYNQDAVRRFEAALEADPEFAAAQLYLLFSLSRHGGSPQRMAELVEALQVHDLDELTARERTLLEVFRSRAAGDADRGEEILKRYLEEHPDDPYVLDLYCMGLTTGGGERQKQAEDCLRHLIEVDPNRVRAQNMLAYIAMNRGDFALAEERFEIYRYLAPDQANPHDSLGELLMVTGRYSRARQEFEQAVALKPDFCPSWENRVTLELLERNPPAARNLLGPMAAAGACPPETRQRLACEVVLWGLAVEGRWEALWERANDADGPCRAEDPEAAHLALRAALETGRLEEARRIQADMEERDLEPGEIYSVRDFLAGHMTALLEDAEGNPEDAVERLRRIDRVMPWGGGMGIFKLFNRLQLAGVLAGVGDEAGAQETMDALAAVNLPFADRPPVSPVHPVPPPTLAAPPAPAAPPPPSTPPPSPPPRSQSPARSPG